MKTKVCRPDSKRGKSSILSKNGDNGNITASDHIIRLMDDVVEEVIERDDSNIDHSDDCQCIVCSDKLFGERRSRKDSRESRTQREILEDSRKADEELISQEKSILSKESFFVQSALMIDKILGFTTISGIILLAINIIIRSIIFPNLVVVGCSAIGIIIFSLVNERMRG